MKRALIAFIASLLIVGPVTSVGAQGRAVRFQGRVLWIAGQSMEVALNDGSSISIDLARLAQGEYHVLGQNDWVVVDAVIVSGSRRVIVTSIQRVRPG